MFTSKHAAKDSAHASAQAKVVGKHGKMSGAKKAAAPGHVKGGNLAK